MYMRVLCLFPRFNRGIAIHHCHKGQLPWSKEKQGKELGSGIAPWEKLSAKKSL
jgi:hypothetical protein